MIIWHCYKDKLTEGFMNPDTATTHASDESDHTLCGVRIGKRIERGGSWERGLTNEVVTCKRCRAAMEKRGLRT